ncbi:hypothetical protein Btru_001382 [Bulinus truncatus]|nr:hypothetical protein Btru_001382 [Bulinus truncatus]
MTSQSRINVYMERHKINALFEDLMNKVLRDMPDDPLIFLLRSLYKKAGIEIPQRIRSGGLHKSTSELNKSVSPERKGRSSVSCLDVEISRDYDRPWANSPPRKTHPKTSEEPSMSKKKPDWNTDNKIKSSTFDELWETKKESMQASPLKKVATNQKSAWDTQSQGARTVNGWASLGLDEKETYTSPNINPGFKKTQDTSISEKNLLSLESVPLSKRSQNIIPSHEAATATCKKQRTDKIKHKEEYSQILSEVEKKSADSDAGYQIAVFDDDHNAIELLENADDLKNEGVKNVQATGYKLSRNLHHQINEPRVNVKISETYAASNELKESDDEEEFESVSQVTGPRHPVWKLPDSDVESEKKKTSKSRGPYEMSDIFQNKFDERLSGASRQSGEDFYSSVLSGTVAQVNNGGSNSSSDYTDSSSRPWVVPDDTEAASAHNWNQYKGLPQNPRAY